MRLHIDKSDHIPIGEQVKTQIRLLIQLGELELHEQLPTVHELATQLEVNPNTIASVYRALEVEGYLVGRKRGGTRVAAKPPIRSEHHLANALAADLSHRVAASGIDLGTMLSLLHAHTSLQSSRANLSIAAVAYTPYQATELAERVRVHLGRGFSVIATPIAQYNSTEHHYALVDADLLVSLRNLFRAASPPPLVDASPWAYDSDFPAGAD